MASKLIVFIVEGQLEGQTRGDVVQPPGGMSGTVKASVRLGSRRAAAESVRINAVPGEDVLVLQFADGPTLTLHPETARDLLRGQGMAGRSATSAASEEVEVSGTLRWRGLEQTAPTRRGSLGEVVLSALHVVSPSMKDRAVELVASHVLARVDGQVDAGVYALRPDSLSALKGSGGKLAQVPPAPNQGALLVLVHGTFVDTVSTFGKLWAQHPNRVRELFAHYAGRVYALDHPTLGQSPIANALTLVQALPDGARLHLVTHSRGGMVAEVLARLTGLRGSLAQALAFFPGSEHALLRQELEQLGAAVEAKNIRVERVVRVACPMRGTLLASGRLDAYLSVLKWSLDLAGLPVLPTLVDFLGEVARRRADPQALPGLAAMLPGSPLVQWLNSAAEPVTGDLRVIAGDLQGDSVGSWLKTLLADAYYWTDNDIVVQTRSMYGGTPRGGGASFLLDRGGKVTHFAYFSNARSVDAIVSALTQDRPAGFNPIGPLSWTGQDSGGQRGVRRHTDDGRPASEKPAVFVLPDVLGSHLKVQDRRIWLSWRMVGALAEIAYDPLRPDRVAPDGVIGLVYDDLIEYLADTHEVITFAYDWRRPIEDEARRLADAVHAALSLRAASGQPVRMVAHSTGGLVARTMQLERPEVWQRMMSRDGARLLMLGTPNAGSYSPMQVLTGDDTLGNALPLLCAPLQDRQGRQVMADMPGFVQAQADLLDPQLGLTDRATWVQMAADDLKHVQQASWWHDTSAAEAAYGWGVPSQAVLDAAVALRRRLDAQRERVLPRFADQLVLVVGHAKFTATGFEMGEAGLAYLDAIDQGDGRVLIDSALLPGVRTWTLDAPHGGLPSTRDAFSAYLDLLVDGDTARIRPHATGLGTPSGGTAMATSLTRSRPSRERSGVRPADSMGAVFESVRDAGPDMAEAGAVRPPLRLTVVNGNLGFVSEPLLVGHYRSLGLSGTERFVDQLLGGAMSASLTLGLYPDAPGSQQVFLNTRRNTDNPWRQPLPVGVIVVGLGEEGKLREQALSLSVRQGVLAWVQHASEGPDGVAHLLTLAATLLGSGGSGITPGSAARAIVQGVRQANLRLAEGGWPLVGELLLVELFLERATEALSGLQVLAASTPGQYEVAPTLRSGVAPISRQFDIGYRGADYDFITATTPDEGVIAFTVNSRRARTEVRAQTTQGRLLQELVGKASSASSQDSQIGRTLFQLLVPPEMDAFLGGTSSVVLEVDAGTAGIPWEALDTPASRRIGDDQRPWAIRCQLLRKLRTSTYREQVQDAISDDDALVIGEPAVDHANYAPLPGARAEALAVVEQLRGPRGMGVDRIVALTDSPDALQIVNALLARSYRIVHITGHGEPGFGGGVVMSGGTVLGPREISMMRIVPELVFVNCCHLAARSSDEMLLAPKLFDRSRFAADTAEALIEIGVRCVIAAGWAVEDAEAALFATTFYRQLLAGAPFVSAVSSAREAAWACGGNTWAAYQCYGDPNWTLRAANTTRARQDEYVGISSPPALTMALQELGSRLRYMGTSADQAVEHIRHLEARFGLDWAGIGAVAEAFGNAYGETGLFDEAVAWYERALRCNDASASMKASEQLGNLRARRAFARTATAEPGSPALAQARAEIMEALQLLQSLASQQPTVERHSLCGSVWRRLAMLEARAGQVMASRRALQQAATSFGAAEQMATDARLPDLFYPALNRMSAELLAHLGDTSWRGFDADAVAAVRHSLQASDRVNPDFWCKLGLIEIDLYEALAQHALAEHGSELVNRLGDLHRAVSTPKLWASVADQFSFELGSYSASRAGDDVRIARDLLQRVRSYAGLIGADTRLDQTPRTKRRASVKPKEVAPQSPAKQTKQTKQAKQAKQAKQVKQSKPPRESKVSKTAPPREHKAARGKAGR